MKPDKYSFDKRYSNYEFVFRYDRGILRDILKQKSSGKVLDLGCGQGGLALDLAQKGFEVTCVDISKVAIERIKEEAKKRNVKINAVIADLENYDINGTYDIIIACGVLQFLHGKGEAFVKQIMKKTKTKGINIIDAFRNKWLPKGKLEELYSEWDVIEKEEYIWEEKNKSRMIYLVVGRRM